MLVVVTGTDGKTTTVHMVRTILARLGWQASSVGTLGIGHDDGWDPLPPGTGRPDSLAAVVRLLGGSVGEPLYGAGRPEPGDGPVLVVEAPSAWLERGALRGLRPTVAAVTNVTSDHLDLHGSTRAYTRAKLRIATDLRPAAVVTGSDDDACRRLRAWARRSHRPIVAVGAQVTMAARSARHRGSPAIHARCVVQAGTGTATGNVAVGSPAAHDRTNAATAIAVCVAAGLDANEVLAAASSLDLPPGRMHHAGSSHGVQVWVDHAHTTAALRASLAALRPLNGRLLVVLGCGGDRDRGKRPRMGAVAREMADLVVVTDDNPRHEDPASIRAAVLATCPDGIEVADRRAAIATALARARPGDVVAVVGRGHETEQVGGPLREDDVSVVRSQLRLAAASGSIPLLAAARRLGAPDPPGAEPRPVGSTLRTSAPTLEPA